MKAGHLLVDGIVHFANAKPSSKLPCGLVVFDRSLESIVQMYVEGAGRDVDCMTCLVAEARERRDP